MKNLRWLLTMQDTTDDPDRGPKYQLRLVSLDEPIQNNQGQSRSMLFSTVDELYRAILAGLDEPAYPEARS